MKKFLLKKPGLLPVAITCFFSGVAFTYFALSATESNPPPESILETRESGFRFINPLLECEQVTNMGETGLKNLKQAIETVLKNYSDLKIGLYYRDLSNGPWLGINEDESFSPQSLLKLPIALAYYKIAENDPQILKEQVAYDIEIKNKNLDTNLTTGQSYPIGFLLNRMLTTSDNISFNLLTVRLPEKFLQKVHQDLNIPYPDPSTPDDYLSVRNYASIFRILFNSSYLSRTYSEMTLASLADNNFTAGLRAGVPDSIVVAHKHGILNDAAISSQFQLHDCGIVYLPEKPYLLCVMTKGSDKAKLTEAIQAISKTVYEDVSGRAN